MKVADFYFNLPEELIAQYPSEQRDGSRMMVVNRRQGSVECGYFKELPDYLDKDDIIVINDTKVIPARLTGTKATGGIIEILLLAKKDETTHSSHLWEVLLRPARRVQRGTKIIFDEQSVAEIVSRISDKKWLVNFKTDRSFRHFLEQHGKAPLPPYIKRDKTSGKDTRDFERYQTVYARVPGSVAAPTAGLHFSENIMKNIKNRGAVFTSITLHVGYGTFLSIGTELVEDHRMEEEYYEISEETADILSKKRRITAVGTTATRVIETATDQQGKIQKSSGYTDLFIYPGYQFKKVRRLLTNFHLPGSSLFLLVCAFAGKDLIMKAYKRAIDEKFRFYSYGDCMLIL